MVIRNHIRYSRLSIKKPLLFTARATICFGKQVCCQQATNKISKKNNQNPLLGILF